MKVRHIADTPIGVYVALSNGKYVVDEDYRHLSIASFKGDRKKIERLIYDATTTLGLENVTVEWRADVRKVSDEEYEEQADRLKNGYVADKYDIGALVDDYNQGRLT